jgi:hypothetical protein
MLLVPISERNYVSVLWLLHGSGLMENILGYFNYKIPYSGMLLYFSLATHCHCSIGFNNMHFLNASVQNMVVIIAIIFL